MHLPVSSMIGANTMIMKYLLSVSPQFVIEFLAIFWLFYIGSRWNLYQLSKVFGRNRWQNFIKIGQQIKNFPIDLYSKISEKDVHRLHSKNPADFYYGSLWASFLCVVGSKRNLDTECDQKLQEDLRNFV